MKASQGQKAKIKNRTQNVGHRKQGMHIIHWLGSKPYIYIFQYEDSVFMAPNEAAAQKKKKKEKKKKKKKKKTGGN